MGPKRSKRTRNRAQVENHYRSDRLRHDRIGNCRPVRRGSAGRVVGNASASGSQPSRIKNSKLRRRIVDLVSTGDTLRANGLIEIETIVEVTSRLAVNRTALKTRPDEITRWIDRFREALHAAAA